MRRTVLFRVTNGRVSLFCFVCRKPMRSTRTATVCACGSFARQHPTSRDSDYPSTRRAEERRDDRPTSLNLDRETVELTVEFRYGYLCVAVDAFLANGDRATLVRQREEVRRLDTLRAALDARAAAGGPESA